MRKISQRKFSHNINHCISIVYYLFYRDAMHCIPIDLYIVNYQFSIFNYQLKYIFPSIFSNFSASDFLISTFPSFQTDGQPPMI